MDLEKVKQIKVVSTNIVESCQHPDCDLPYNGDFFESNVNHYLKEHGYKLLHLGQESTPDHNGQTYHSTVAILVGPENY